MVVNGNHLQDGARHGGREECCLVVCVKDARNEKYG